MPQQNANDSDEQGIPPAGSGQSAPARGAAPDDEEPISLVETVGGSQVKAAGAMADRLRTKAEHKRPLNVTGQGATRCRVFHSKISIAALSMMEDQINEWLDSEEIEIKHVGHTIGMLQGKTAEENLLVVVWY